MDLPLAGRIRSSLQAPRTNQAQRYRALMTLKSLTKLDSVDTSLQYGAKSIRIGSVLTGQSLLLKSSV
jgi:hypothetical protein